jgi:N6-adenosine-specific RNA methylase IME4
VIIVASHATNKLELDDDRVILSVPSAIHSHKPPLIEVLKDCGLKTDSCLELFGRYLLPNFVTLGNQALLFQNDILFCNTDNND